MNKKVGVLNTNFGFGPVAKANYLIEELKKHNISIYYFGSGSSLEFITENQKDESIVYMTVHTDNLTDEDLTTLYEMDLIVNIMNTDFLQKYDSEKVTSVFIDSLAWMWQETLTGIQKVKRYYVQNYLLNYSKQNLSNAVVVAPITTRAIGWELNREDTLINFSGMVNPFSEDGFFIDYMIFNLKIILSITPQQEKVFVSVNKKYVPYLREKFKGYTNLAINFYIQKDFQTLLKKINTVYTTSGITFLLEIYNSNINVKLLLPSNYSQHLMNELYNDNKLFGEVITLSLFGYNDVPEEEEKGVIFVKKVLEDIVQSQETAVKNWYIRNKENTVFPKREKIANTLGQIQIVEDIMKSITVISKY
jgi:hypothetical protein